MAADRPDEAPPAAGDARDAGSTTRPARVQLSRRKGWRKPAGTVVVARPGPWGNPFRVGDVGPDGAPIATRAAAVDWYRRLVTEPPPGHAYEELRGRNLACWCPLDGPCHADVLLERANAPPDDGA